MAAAGAAGAGGRAGSQAKITLSMPDAASLEEVRLILAYEAGVRGMTIGQAASELVMEAADVASYPPELRERLAEIEAAAERRAVERSLRASRPAGEQD